MTSASDATARGTGRTFVSDALALQSAQVAGLVLSLATFWILGNALDAAEFGSYSLVLSLSSYLFTIAASWGSQGFVRFGREEFVRHGSLVESTGARLLLASAPYAVVIVLLAASRRPLFEFIGVPGGTIWLVGLLLLLQIGSDGLTGALQALGRFKAASLYQVLDKALFLVCVAGAWRWGSGLDTVVALLALAVGRLAALVTCGARLPVVMYRRPRLTAAALDQQWRFSRPLLAPALLSYAPTIAGPYVLNYFLNPAEVGRYNLGYQLFASYQGLTATTLSLLLVPVLTDLVVLDRGAALRLAIGRMLGQLVVLNQLVVAVVTAVGASLLPVLFPKLAGGSQIFVLLMAASPLQLQTSAYSALLTGMKRSRPIAMVNLLAAVTFVPLYWVLVPILGTFAPAVVWVTWYVFSSAAYLASVRRAGQSVAWSDLSPAWLACAGGLATALAGTFGPGWASATAILGALLLLVISRRAGWFAASDADLVTRIGLPEALRAPLRALYAALDRQAARAA